MRSGLVLISEDLVRATSREPSFPAFAKIFAKVGLPAFESQQHMTKGIAPTPLYCSAK